MQRYGVEAQIADRSVCPPFEAHAFPPNHEWTVVIWPGNFQDIAAARALSESLSTAVVSSHEHDNDYWTLVVFDDGRLVVRFASQPSYFSQSPGETRHPARKWSGPPVALARTFQLPVASIKPYLVHNATGKAFPGDEFPRENFWVFTDLWQRLGIEYPLDINGYTHVLRVGKGFLDKLPTEGEL